MNVNPEQRCVLVKGMHGLGDNIHQRGIIRHLLQEQKKEVFLKTSWPSAYHDFVGLGLKFIRDPTNQRTSEKNASRQDTLFHNEVVVPKGNERGLLVIWYRREEVNRLGSVYKAMCSTAEIDPEVTDFRLPVLQEWTEKFKVFMAKYKIRKPIMIYRPLVERIDWTGCPARNPDFSGYSALFHAIRSDFFVVSIADIKENHEQIVGPGIKADIEFHRGELHFELLVALFKEAALVYSSPGMAIPLAQALGIPSVCVFGGFEKKSSFSFGARYAPYHSVGPYLDACGCWDHSCRCVKQIDTAKEIPKLQEFVKKIEIGIGTPNVTAPDCATVA